MRIYGPQIQNEVVVSLVIILERARDVYIPELINKLSQRDKCAFERGSNRYRTAAGYVVIVQRYTGRCAHAICWRRSACGFVRVNFCTRITGYGCGKICFRGEA